MLRSTRRGSALSLSLVVLVVFTVLGAALTAVSSAALQRGRADVARQKAIAVAEAGAAQAYTYLRTTAPDGTVDGTWRTDATTGTLSGSTYTMRVANGAD